MSYFVLAFKAVKADVAELKPFTGLPLNEEMKRNKKVLKAANLDDDYNWTDVLLLLLLIAH